jgi:hypothetical protein
VDVKRLRQLEAEIARLKMVLAERVIDIAILKEVAAKNVWPALFLQGPSKDLRQIGLPKCIRPVSETFLVSGPDGTPRTCGLINGSVYDHRA